MKACPERSEGTLAQRDSSASPQNASRILRFAQNDMKSAIYDRAKYICAPVYGEVLGLTTEVVLGPEDGLPRTCAVRCDFLTLMFKTKLTHFVGTLSPTKIAELNRALAYALELPLGISSLPPSS